MKMLNLIYILSIILYILLLLNKFPIKISIGQFLIISIIEGLITIIYLAVIIINSNKMGEKNEIPRRKSISF